MIIDITDTPTAVPGLIGETRYMLQNQTPSRRAIFVVAATSAPSRGDAAELLAFGERWRGRKFTGSDIYVWTVHEGGGGKGVVVEAVD